MIHPFAIALASTSATTPNANVPLAPKSSSQPPPITTIALTITPLRHHLPLPPPYPSPYPPSTQETNQPESPRHGPMPSNSSLNTTQSNHQTSAILGSTSSSIVMQPPSPPSKQVYSVPSPLPTHHKGPTAIRPPSGGSSSTSNSSSSIPPLPTTATVKASNPPLQTVS